MQWLIVLGIGGPLAGGATMSAVLHLLGVSFGDQIVIAVVSAVVSGVFVVGAAVITLRAGRDDRGEERPDGDQ
jgi:hypothetical protein